jgi:hypothetical protein
MRGIRAGLWALVLIGLGAFLFPVLADQEAVITLGVTPLPPDCVQNPGGTAAIAWSITHQTTPDHVTYHLYDPTHTIIYDQQVYPGSTGLNISRNWTVPSPLPQGFYWVRVEYYSVGIGLEAWAETGFLICAPSHVCCVGEVCVIVPEAECVALGGVFHPELDSCGPPNPCALPHVCCVGETCFLVLAEDCAELGGVFHPELDSCGPPNPCALPHVCCVGEDCIIVLVEECDAQGGVFHPELDSCGPPNPCALPHVCCVGANCFLLTQEECDAQGGLFLPEFDSCDPENPCANTPALPDSWGGLKNLYR